MATATQHGVAAIAPVTEDLATDIAQDAYLYAYPLVPMEVTRRVFTNCAEPDAKLGSRAPMNQFAHMQAFPDATFTDVVRANADTLDSSLFFDVAADGSLDIYLQRESPGQDKDRNWLPTPAEGPFSLTMRLYWPKPAAIDGSWAPPPVQPVG